MSHWIAYRKINAVWYDLNSSPNYLLIDPQPVRITEFFLSAQLSKLQDEGFQVYVIRGQLPTLGRLAPKTHELQGEYAWVQAADIKSHVELDKTSRIRQQREQQCKTQQLMASDPQQYAALTGDDMPMVRQLQQQAQHAPYLEYEPQQKPQNSNQNRFSNPFNKLRSKFSNGRTRTQSNNNNHSNHKRRTTHDAHEHDHSHYAYMSELERVKQESLRTAQQEAQRRVSFDAYTYTDANTPDIANINNMTQSQTQSRLSSSGGSGLFTAQQIMVVSPPALPAPPEPLMIARTATDEDVQLAMALSASGMPQPPPPPLPPPRHVQRNEPVELEYARTQHRQPHQALQCQDFLNLPSLRMHDDEKQLPMVEDEDPFAPLIREYSSNNGMDEDDNDMVIVQQKNHTNTNSNLLDFDDALNVDAMKHIHRDTYPHSSRSNNPLVTSMPKSDCKNTSQIVDDQLWEMLEKSLSD
mmetsp:Transcript_41382/g.68099  ORF Transcript_41382/g.68099 Transcript_41382/m.68099 type:complete len:468 (-) Transcript_41382:73-1476(-)